MTLKHSMLNEEDILPELKQYQKWYQAYVAGARKEDRPHLPENSDSPKYNSYWFFGTLIDSLLFLGSVISSMLRIYIFVGFFAELRISTDRFSLEPLSCGYNSAYTRLRIVLLSRNDVRGAIECLDASWRVYPCPHNTSYGLKRGLVTKLKNYPEASQVVEQYINIGTQFVQWPERWVDKINKS